jgi:hypothetical protein
MDINFNSVLDGVTFDQWPSSTAYFGPSGLTQNTSNPNHHDQDYHKFANPLKGV